MFSERSGSVKRQGFFKMFPVTFETFLDNIETTPACFETFLAVFKTFLASFVILLSTFICRPGFSIFGGRGFEDGLACWVIGGASANVIFGFGNLEGRFIFVEAKGMGTKF